MNICKKPFALPNYWVGSGIRNFFSKKTKRTLWCMTHLQRYLPPKGEIINTYYEKEKDFYIVTQGEDFGDDNLERIIIGIFHTLEEVKTMVLLLMI